MYTNDSKEIKTKENKPTTTSVYFEQKLTIAYHRLYTIQKTTAAAQNATYQLEPPRIQIEGNTKGKGNSRYVSSKFWKMGRTVIKEKLILKGRLMTTFAAVGRRNEHPQPIRQFSLFFFFLNAFSCSFHERSPPENGNYRVASRATYSADSKKALMARLVRSTMRSTSSSLMMKGGAMMMVSPSMPL